MFVSKQQFIQGVYKLNAREVYECITQALKKPENDIKTNGRYISYTDDNGVKRKLKIKSIDTSKDLVYLKDA